MRPLLFYTSMQQVNEDHRHRDFLQNLFGLGVDSYPILEHRSAYDHKHIPEYFPGTDTPMPSSCWCDIPDPNNTWPQLYFNPERADRWKGTARFVAAGDDILALDIDKIHKEFGTNISGPGDWEI